MKKFSNLFLLVLPLLVMIISGCSSVPCELTPANAPELRGFKLGMTLQEIKQKYPNMPSVSANEYGLGKIYFDRDGKNQESKNGFTFINSNNYKEFEGTKRVYLEVVDEKVAEITIVYTNEIKWKSDDEFVKKTAESLGITGSWTKESDYQRLQCKDSLFFVSGIKKDLSYIPTSTDEKFPFIEISNIWMQMQPELKRMDKENEANKQREIKKDTFKP